MPAPDLTALKAYLGTLAGSATDSQLNIALATELAAQARVCNVGTYEDNDLVEVVFRRVARNLATKNLPLGMKTDPVLGSVRIGSQDPEVRRLEGPFRKRVVG